ncbi:YjcB family protein [Pantoea sp. Mb-10]|uniref:YjcB family protein n=1 Tax=unclassified Pantoea TaxID=2630326 RepID=UPI001E399BE0|nr:MULTISPECIES: YjcB family protein [unclassified Pantoea]MCE0490237.1 YjcB family protein [Pantoea sp. Mb-10]MCE0501368.1 YjcB family protein [Pantoea sp. Pb-8]
MATLTTSLLVMRWELLSAIMMFFASTLKIKMRQRSHPVIALMFGGLGVGMSCWFVTGLLGITLSMENLHNFMEISKTAFVNAMSQAPAEWPMP